MAISFLGSRGATAINGGDPSIDLSTLGLAQNDLVIVGYAIGDNDNVDFPMAMVTAGYTEVCDVHADSNTDTDLGVYWKFMGATPDSTAVVDGTGGTDAALGAVAFAFRGVDTTTPMDVAPTTATGTTSNRPNPPSIDHLNPSGVATVAVGAFSHTSGAAVTATAPTNYTNLHDESADDTTDITIAMALRAAPSDPEDPGIFTPSIGDSNNNSWCACTIALRPSAATSATRGRISWAELETPNAATRGRISWAELETPLVSTRGRISFAEIEVPIAPTRGRVSFAELEVPNVPTRGRISFAEIEVPDQSLATRGRVSWAEFELPPVATRGRISWAEFEGPDLGAGLPLWPQNPLHVGRGPGRF